MSKKRFTCLLGCGIKGIWAIFKTEMLIYQSEADLDEGMKKREGKGRRRERERVENWERRRKCVRRNEVAWLATRKEKLFVNPVLNSVVYPKD